MSEALERARPSRHAVPLTMRDVSVDDALGEDGTLWAEHGWAIGAEQTIAVIAMLLTVGVILALLG